MDCGGRWRQAPTISNQPFSERSGHSVWVHLCLWFCRFPIHSHNVTVSLNNSSWIHWLHSSQGNIQYFTSTKQFSVCVGRPYDDHREQYGHTLLSTLQGLLQRSPSERDGALLLWASAYSPTSILMFWFYQQKSHANVPPSAPFQ